jgi:hypothetical protein
MTDYVVHLPDVDIHLHGEDLFNAIMGLSNAVDDEGHPLFVTNDLYEATKVVRLAYAVCQDHSADTEFNIRITPLEAQPNVE